MKKCYLTKLSHRVWCTATCFGTVFWHHHLITIFKTTLNISTFLIEIQINIYAQKNICTSNIRIGLGGEDAPSVASFFGIII